ncbi:MAG: PAS domain-containing protein [Hyphomicrobiales bacterium]|nr:PAS domain-containing protein [Hyphomicrobiales bacterium]
MRHASIRELFAHWNERRGLRSAPERNEIEPSAIRRVLADTFILSYDTASRHPFRLAGTRVCALFGRDLKNEAFLDLWSPAGRVDLNALLAVVTGESVGVVAGASGASAGEPALDLELILLPLAYHGRTDARVIGALAPASPPGWLGARILSDLELGAHRYLDPLLMQPLSPPQRPSMPMRARIRHGFVVYDGGLA